MLAELTSREVAEWEAFYIVEDSDQRDEVTRWDDEDSAAEKMRKKAARDLTTHAGPRR